MAKIAKLVHYPVKGCGGIELPVAELTEAGIRHDRTFMAAAPDGTFRSQRRYPVLAAVRVAVLDDGARLRLRAPGVEELEHEVRFDGPRHAASVFTFDGKGVHQGAEAAEWFSEVIGEPSVLLRVTPEHERLTSGVTAGTAAFADGHAVLVTSEASLDSLNERIASAGGEPVPMDRFRANIVVSGWAEPHVEDTVRTFAAGEIELGYAKKCLRCTVPLVDQETGRRAGSEPIRSLAKYRRVPAGKVAFGMKAAVTRPGRLAVGDEVAVRTWETEPPE
ncbi:MOSC domain-containing protein [Amycolatopsis albispora]|uniref:Molybdenum cofactor sulfurase n=1 Tax=Amycolatopsis albispora TaxID=1804986 RepID=A0A344LLN2_9PSEU|nr:MOSC N-terminal beta barrel domain-containing protein [Amycolatopsis albispora]AXB48956.1 molybdenum cofactor sulfurase [Amycolatopsis albispora]